MRATAQELEQVIRVARRSRQVLLATVNEAGEPVFTPIQECRLKDETLVSIKAWADIPPLEHRDGQTKMALLIWDTGEGHGYQLSGHAVQSRTTAAFSSYADIEEREHLQQPQREILMEVDSIRDLQFGGRESWQS
jgi:predicted pyridoxine 5'-phosphate oxidase superfamily flavin-nucleotide-binding protein